MGPGPFCQSVDQGPAADAHGATASAALQGLFAAQVVVRERRLPGAAGDLLPSEAAHVTHARPKRVGEFAAGRACARSALQRLGIHDFALLPAPDRQPVWPRGVVGSITHTAGFCAAALALQSNISALGIDTEIVGAPTPDIWSTLCREEELAWVSSLPDTQQAAAVTLVFSAKEAFYKCQYPMTAEWLDFHDVSIQVSRWGEAAGTFTARPTRPLRFERYVERIEARYRFHEEFVSAGVSVPAGAPGPQ